MTSTNKWTPEQDKVLKELYPNPRVSVDDIMKILPGKTKDAITARASRLRLHAGTKAQINEEELMKLRKVIRI